jgi:hypothetical protein
VHQSELLLIYFTDGSIMGIDTGSNAANLRDRPSQPEDFHVDFRMHRIPPKVTKRKMGVNVSAKYAGTGCFVIKALMAVMTFLPSLRRCASAL